MNLGTAQVIRGDARHLPLADNSVDLVVTSPPYFGLRSYQDGGIHYDGQIGSEPTPAEFVAALLEVTAECVRVLKPSGSLFVNLGDKYATRSAGLAKSEGQIGSRAGARDVNPRRPLAYPVARDGHRPGALRDKSLIGIPWRYALACIDQLGLILRAELIWSKPNGLPESVTDRVRRSHEQWFHFTLEPRYFSAVDEIREAHAPKTLTHRGGGQAYGNDRNPDNQWGNPNGKARIVDPLGKLPGSVWSIPTEPLTVPDHLGIDHFAAFPTEWPRRIIQGWSPAGVCVECGEGRRPLRGRACEECGALVEANTKTCLSCGHRRGREWLEDRDSQDEWLTDNSKAGLHAARRDKPTQVSTMQGGYACACPEPTAPTRPSVILDPFGGTGTVAMVAKALGRHGITVDMSADYCRLAEWRTNDRDQLAKVLGIAKAGPVDHGQDDLLALIDEVGA